MKFCHTSPDPTADLVISQVWCRQSGRVEIFFHSTCGMSTTISDIFSPKKKTLTILESSINAGPNVILRWKNMERMQFSGPRYKRSRRRSINTKEQGRNVRRQWTWYKKNRIGQGTRHLVYFDTFGSDGGIRPRFYVDGLNDLDKMDGERWGFVMPLK